MNCWKPQRKSRVISSQAEQECSEGSETRAWSPERTVKLHECAASLNKDEDIVPYSFEKRRNWIKSQFDKISYASAKKAIGNGGITLGAGVFKMQLHRASASATIMVLSTRALASSVAAEISATGGYAAHGRNLVPAAGKWSTGSSARQLRFSYSSVGLVFTAASGNLSGGASGGIKYALIRNSVSATGGKVLCYCTLSSTAFSISSGNSLTITPASVGGVFTLA